MIKRKVCFGGCSQCQAIGGYFLHASSEFEYTSVIKREQEFVYKKETPYQREEISVLTKECKGKSTLSFFKLPLPVSDKQLEVPYSGRRMSIQSQSAINNMTVEF